MITILGSTGTIGKNTLSVLKNIGKQNKVFALSANKNIKLLFQQIKDFNPRYAVISDQFNALKLIEFCNKNVAGISDSLSQFHGAQISRASDKPRNPSNKASDVEIKSIDSLKALKAAGASLTPISFETENQVITHYPIPTAGMCLKCHADTQKTISSAVQQKLQSLYPEDMATGYQVGDIRGIWVVKMDKDIQK